jgi:hypothetical protein
MFCFLFNSDLTAKPGKICRPAGGLVRGAETGISDAGLKSGLGCFGVESVRVAAPDENLIKNGCIVFENREK